MFSTQPGIDVQDALGERVQMLDHAGNVNLTLLNTDETISRLLSLIKNARKEVWLVSPYITLGGENRIGQAIQVALSNKVSVTMVCRIEDDAQSFLRTFSEHLQPLVERGLRIQVLPKLHAKLYWSESEVIITSLNLLSTSFLSSIEVGLWSQNPADVAEIQTFFGQEIEPHFLSAEEFRKRVGIRAGDEPRAARSSRPKERARAVDLIAGYCIRCASAIDLDPEKPYCWSDFQAWAKFENADYVDSFCHGCGKEFSATMNKPLCRSCYRQMNG